MATTDGHTGVHTALERAAEVRQPNEDKKNHCSGKGIGSLQRHRAKREDFFVEE